MAYYSDIVEIIGHMWPLSLDDCMSGPALFDTLPLVATQGDVERWAAKLLVMLSSDQRERVEAGNGLSPASAQTRP
jgi:hypothetical protein